MLSVSKFQDSKSATLELNREFDAGAVRFNNATNYTWCDILWAWHYMMWHYAALYSFSLFPILGKSVEKQGLILESLMGEACLVQSAWWVHKCIHCHCYTHATLCSADLLCSVPSISLEISRDEGEVHCKDQNEFLFANCLVIKQSIRNVQQFM